MSNVAVRTTSPWNGIVLMVALIQDQDLLMQASVAMKKLGQPEATNKIVSQVTH